MELVIKSPPVSAMSLWIVFSGIFVPALFWIGYFHYKDRFRPEPLKTVIMAYGLGVLAALACFYFYRLLALIGIPDDPGPFQERNRLLFLVYSVAVTGFFEELFKFLPFFLVFLRIREFNERTDGVLYASYIALGFASFENIGYFTFLSGFELFGRAFASPLTHTIFSSIWGYQAGMARLMNKSIPAASLRGLALASAAHGLFNFFTTSVSPRIAASLLILFIWVWRIRFLEKEGKKAKLQNFTGTDQFI